MSAAAETILSISHMAVHFGGLVAISDMTFDVKRGEIVGLIGPNGAGKTTAFNVITGFQRQADGEVRYLSHLLTGMKPHEIARRGLVRTFQRTSVFKEQSVFQECAHRPALQRTLKSVGYNAEVAPRSCRSANSLIPRTKSCGSWVWRTCEQPAWYPALW
jgi:ABC-type branched-subunit amino acid transport system ATPase component